MVQPTWAGKGWHMTDNKLKELVNFAVVTINLLSFMEYWMVWGTLSIDESLHGKVMQDKLQG